MLYQEINETGSHFGVFSYQTEYNGNLMYGKTIKEINANIQRDYEMSVMNMRDMSMLDMENQTLELPPLVMPTIEPCALTAEQQVRFDVVSLIPDITLDDVRGYTFEGKAGQSVAYKLYAQTCETILQGQMITDLEINEITNAQTITELELMILGGK